MRRLKDGEIPKPTGEVTVVAESADAKAFDPKDFNLELDKVKGGYGYGGYGGGYGGGGYGGGGYSGGWGSYASWGGGWANW